MSEDLYSSIWFQTFLHSVDPGQTRREVQFVSRQLPPQQYRSILDVCCGFGRHALELSSMGYQVTGIDIDPAAIGRVRASAQRGAAFLIHDMRAIEKLDGTFDAVTLLWQSFGQFDEATNHDILRQISAKLRVGRRFILDIYHRAFFEAHQGTLELERAGRRYRETKHMHGNRLRVHLEYEEGGSDRLEWQLFMPDEIARVAGSLGMQLRLSCTEFDEACPPAEDSPRVQYVFEKQ
jgi:SAM-dependent methyltransferase